MTSTRTCQLGQQVHVARKESPREHTAFRMPAYQVTARGGPLDLCAFVRFLGPQGRHAAIAGITVLLVSGGGDRVWQRAGVSSFQHQRLVTVLGVDGDKIAPDALLDLVLDLIGQSGMSIDELAERLSVLRRRRQRLAMRPGFVRLARGYLLGLARRASRRFLLAHVARLIVGGMGDGRGQMLLVGDGGLVGGLGGQTIRAARLLGLGSLVGE